MQFCKKHWDDLRAAITEKGMYHLVSSSGEEAAARVQKQQQGQATPPDPLLEAHNMIISRALELLGLYLLNDPAMQPATLDTDLAYMQHYCPLCEARKHLPAHPELNLPCDEAWIVTLTDYLRQEYTREGWINNN